MFLGDGAGARTSGAQNFVEMGLIRHQFAHPPGDGRQPVHSEISEHALELGELPAAKLLADLRRCPVREGREDGYEIERLGTGFEAAELF
jgi:hypothetical protein